MRVILVLLSIGLTGCVADSVKYDPVGHTIDAHRFALFTNIGSLSAHVIKNADGSITVRIDESNIDQMTAAAQALSAAAQLTLKGTP